MSELPGGIMQFVGWLSILGLTGFGLIDGFRQGHTTLSVIMTVCVLWALVTFVLFLRDIWQSAERARNEGYNRGYHEAFKASKGDYS